MILTLIVAMELDKQLQLCVFTWYFKRYRFKPHKNNMNKTRTSTMPIAVLQVMTIQQLLTGCLNATFTDAYTTMIESTIDKRNFYHNFSFHIVYCREEIDRIKKQG